MLLFLSSEFIFASYFIFVFPQNLFYSLDKANLEFVGHVYFEEAARYLEDSCDADL